LAKTYRVIQQWDHWLTQYLGQYVLQTEQRFLSRSLAVYRGKHALLIGVPRQNILLKPCIMTNHFALSPLADRLNRIRFIESKFNELPIATDSIDLVLIAHALEVCENPEKLLSEACRIVKPEGHIIILGFNPFSLWGLVKWLTKSDNIPWSLKFLKPSTIIQWLESSHFELQFKNGILFQPPLKNPIDYNKFRLFEWIGQKLFSPFGGIYVLAAKSKVIPLTPIKLKWKQKIPVVNVSIPRPTMRGS